MVHHTHTGALPPTLIYLLWVGLGSVHFFEVVLPPAEIRERKGVEIERRHFLINQKLRNHLAPLLLYLSAG